MMALGMKASLRTTLSLSYLAVVLVGVGIAAALAWFSIEALYVETQRQNLLAQANLIAKTLRLDALPAGPGEPYSQLSNAASGLHTRLIDVENAAILQLDAPVGTTGPATRLELPQLARAANGVVTAEELFSRPEIAQARSGSPATAIRRVEAAGGQPVLYAAVPILSGTGGVSQIVYLATPLPNTQWSALPANVQIQFLFILLIAVTLASGAGLWLSRRISRPLSGVLRTVEAIAAGDYSQPALEDPSIVEISRLGQGVNQMMRNLQQADLAKSHFIAGVSHELRTPLTVIKGTIETLQDGALDDREARGPFLESMSKETERLIRLVNDLLILTRVDSGELHLKIQDFDLQALAVERYQHFETLAQAANVRFCLRGCEPGEENQSWVRADPDRVTQVLDNILDNAIHYSPEHSVITLSIEKLADGRVTCHVSDQGPGIAARHLPYLFDRFYRVDATRSHNNGGSGLGLAIVRELLEAQGGQVEVESTEGQGATFRFTLPGVGTLSGIDTPTAGTSSKLSQP